MSYEDNLKKGEQFRFRTGDEQVETARKGGKASGEARRRKKTMRDTAKMLLDMDIPKQSKELKAKLSLMGVSEDDLTYQSAVMVAMLNQAMKGNTKAAAFLRDTIGEGPGDIPQEGESSLADTIEEAYRQRMEGGGDAKQ